MPYIRRSLLVILLALILTNTAQAQSYLSNLSISGTDPLFATYAAPMHRSQFVLDEGYQFKFYEANNGIDFETDQAGELGLIFKLNGKVRYLLDSMHQKPEITLSYPDLVKYRYQPFEQVEVKITFQVYSSRMAFQDIEVINQRDSSITLDLYSFAHHDKAFEHIQISSSRRYSTFGHQEPPDGWTRNHNVPFIEDVKNIYLVNREPFAAGIYGDLGMSGSGSSSSSLSTAQIDLPDQNYAVEWGRVYNPDGSPNEKRPPNVQQIILHNGNGAEILTEKAPKWGDQDPNIPGNGYQGAELGNFQHPDVKKGDTFTVIFTDLAAGTRGTVTDTIPPLPADGGIPVDPIRLNNVSFPSRPNSFAVHFAENGQEAEITWQSESGLSYDLYRRTETRRGRFDRIARELQNGRYLDQNLTADSNYVYTLIARGENGKRSPHTLPKGEGVKKMLFSAIEKDSLSGEVSAEEGGVVAYQYRWTLDAGGNSDLRLVRGVAPDGAPTDSLRNVAESLLNHDSRTDINRNEELYASIPDLQIDDPERNALYWNSFTLMRQVFYPPAGMTDYNYYVFSREPTWGWGHGGQVFHESIAMLAYVFMDGKSAQHSQRVYMERQHDNGYIDYRSGGYLSEQIPVNDELTSSAPWFSWENWMIYKETGDQVFLRDAYVSGKQFFDFWLKNRNEDNDGLMEWGGAAGLESVRDALVAVWSQVGNPKNFESLALNTMLVKEAKSLAHMAKALGDSAAAAEWNHRADTLSQLINETFWDEETGFYYMVDRDDHDFSYKQSNDLKRKEIIGFLPLWSGTATREQAEKLVKHLTNPDTFWRQHGIPSLSAGDPYYNHSGYSGYWNGPVWVQWQYLIFRGLLNYGYEDLARQLADKVFNKVTFHLKRDHTFWEMYSPDTEWAGHHQTYIWTGIVARMMIDLKRTDTGIGKGSKDKPMLPDKVKLGSNAPNPFNPSTTIRFELPESRRVSLNIYNTLGRKVATILDNQMKKAGRHTVEFKAGELASGVYVYRFSTPKQTLSRKMTLLK